MRKSVRSLVLAGVAAAVSFGPCLGVRPALADPLAAAFDAPPQAAKPWVYWYFMDGHITREGLTADLEAMKKAGIGGAIFLTVNLGVPKPKPPVEFMSPEWQDLYAHMIREADRLGIAISLGIGPGWSGNGGPWMRPEETMQHLVASVTKVTGGRPFDAVLARPKPREPFFGRASLSRWMLDTWLWFYHDECVLAYPTPRAKASVPNADEKALYFRAPYSSAPRVRPYFEAPADPTPVPAEACLDRAKAIDLTDKLDKDGRLRWDAPPGEWTVYRFGRTLQGQNTRPSPSAGLGFESDKFNARAFAAHAKAFLRPLIDRAGKPSGPNRGLTTLHLDSWEMGAQNWTPGFRDRFQKRRGYDPLPYLPAMLGHYVTDAATTERFLWDLRQTGRELVHDEFLVPLREYAHANGLRYSVEGYDMNPAGDLMVLGTGDVQMGEFWAKGFGFKTEFSVVEATSAAHTKGQPIVGAEAFTASGEDKWQLYPARMKLQGDWALAAGVNWFVFHRYQHQPKLDEFPGQRMGKYGVFWDRTQTWWDMVPAYHDYLTRASALLQRGTPVADVLYLAPEGAPHVFRPPASALIEQGGLPDRRGYNFDGVDPDRLLEATVTDGRVAFAGGASYAVLVLPQYDTMRPAMLRKVKSLLDDGATVIGGRPLRSPSLADRAAADAEVAALAAEIWGDLRPDAAGERRVGRGRLVNDVRTRPAPPPPDPLEAAKWVWFDDGTKSVTAPVGTCYFSATLNVPTLDGLESAELLLRVDNAFEATLNGQAVGKGDDFARLARIDVSKALKVGKNVLDIAATNGGDKPNSAGLLGGLVLRYADGRIVSSYSNGAWTSATAADGAKKGSKVLADVPASWQAARKQLKFDDLYVDYDATARLMRDAGLPPDFESEKPLRYTHRRDADAEIYFVANPAEEAVDIRATFRVTGHVPEWWNPMTGRRRPLPEFAEAGGRTTLPLRLPPGGSGFVVFRPAPAAHPTPAGTNAPMTTNVQAESLVAAVAGPWRVVFDPRWGGPAGVTFDTLHDWSTRPEPGIRFYSGRATYHTTFDLPARDSIGKPNVLSLGDVRAMAGVKLNGRDLGVAWCAPWTLDVPPDVLRPMGNELEITVANLWINRLIGDAALPERERLTKTTSNPYTANDKLQPAGLLGPVEIRTITP